MGLNGGVHWVPTHILKEAAELAEMVERNARTSTAWGQGTFVRSYGGHAIGTYVKREVDPNQLELPLEGGAYYGGQEK